MSLFNKARSWAGTKGRMASLAIVASLLVAMGMGWAPAAAAAGGSATVNVGDASIHIHSAWARAGVKGGTSALYLVLHNDGTSDAQLVDATSAVANTVELHETTFEELPGPGGISTQMMRMERVYDIPVPAGEELTFHPGGLHVMLIDLTEALAEGDDISVGLVFTADGAEAEVTLHAPVASGDDDDDHHHHHHH